MTSENHITFPSVALLGSVALVIVFMTLNWTNIIYPEFSPGFSCGAPFGDSLPRFMTWGITVPRALILAALCANGFHFLLGLKATHQANPRPIQMTFLAAALLVAMVLSLNIHGLETI